MVYDSIQESLNQDEIAYSGLMLDKSQSKRMFSCKIGDEQNPTNQTGEHSNDKGF